MKRPIQIIIVLILSIASLMAQGSGETFIKTELTVNGVISQIDEFGETHFDIRITDFYDKGFELGDTVDIFYENGFSLIDVPFYNGYYVGKGEPLLRAYPGAEFLAAGVNYEKLYLIGDLKVGDKVTLTLNTKAKVLENQILSNLITSNNAEDFDSLEAFANFRMVKTGNIKENRLYRGCSPINNSMNRALVCNEFVKKVGIKTVLNLSDDSLDIENYAKQEGFNQLYYYKLYCSGGVIALNLGSDFNNDAFGYSLIEGFKKMLNMEPPFYIHCLEGKYRTAFVVMLISAITEGSEQEMIDDLMLSFQNFYNVSKNDSKRYEKVMNYYYYPIKGIIQNDYPSIKDGAIAYLLKYGMNEQEIQSFIDLFCR